MTSLPNFAQLTQFPGTPVKDIFTTVADNLLALLDKLLAINPLNRCTASEALQMPYFSNAPAPTPGPHLPWGNSNSAVLQEPHLKLPAKRKLKDVKTSRLAKRLIF